MCLAARYPDLKSTLCKVRSLYPRSHSTQNALRAQLELSSEQIEITLVCVRIKILVKIKLVALRIVFDEGLRYSERNKEVGRERKPERDLKR